jgi:hypothetical protein
MGPQALRSVVSHIDLQNNQTLIFRGKPLDDYNQGAQIAAKKTQPTGSSRLRLC